MICSSNRRALVTGLLFTILITTALGLMQGCGGSSTASPTPSPTPIPGCTGACATPTLVQDVSWGTNDGGQAASMFKYHLPNPALFSNLLVCGLSYDSTTATVAITDNMGTNNWTAGASTNDGTRTTALYYASGAAAGTQDITVTFSQPVLNQHFRCSEFYNVATSSAVDGTPSGASHVTGPAVAAGSITTAGDNDLVYHYGVDDAGLCCTNHVGSFVVGSGFNLLTADRHLGHFAQYLVLANHGVVNPTMTANQRSPDSFASVAIAFKAASAGTAPSSGIRIVREYHTSANAAAYTVQFPCTGNLVVSSTAQSASDNPISSIVDSDGNAYTRVATPDNNYPQMYYAANAGCTNPNSRTVTVNNANSGVTMIVVLYDIAGAATAPFDTSASAIVLQVAAGGLTCGLVPGSDTPHAPDITPTTANGLAIGILNDGTGPPCSMMSPGFTFDAAIYNGQDDSSTGLLDSSDGYSHIYNTTASTLNFGYHWANATTTGGHGLAAAFKAK